MRDRENESCEGLRDICEFDMRIKKVKREIISLLKLRVKVQNKKKFRMVSNISKHRKSII